MTAKQYYNKAVRECRATRCYHCCLFPKEYCKQLDEQGIKLSACKEYYHLSVQEKLIVQAVTKGAML